MIIPLEVPGNLVRLNDEILTECTIHLLHTTVILLV